jgi:osmotically-inducible protein OsmY
MKLNTIAISCIVTAASIHGIQAQTKTAAPGAGHSPGGPAFTQAGNPSPQAGSGTVAPSNGSVPQEGNNNTSANDQTGANPAPQSQSSAAGVTANVGVTANGTGVAINGNTPNSPPSIPNKTSTNAPRRIMAGSTTASANGTSANAGTTQTTSSPNQPALANNNNTQTTAGANTTSSQTLNNNAFAPVTDVPAAGTSASAGTAPAAGTGGTSTSANANNSAFNTTVPAATAAGLNRNANLATTSQQDLAFSSQDQATLVHIRSVIYPQLRTPAANTPIHVVVQDGAVTLVGYVSSNDERTRIENVVRRSPGVVSVDDQIRVNTSNVNGVTGNAAAAARVQPGVSSPVLTPTGRDNSQNGFVRTNGSASVSTQTQP